MKQPKGNSFTRLNQFAEICERQYWRDCLHRRPSTPAMEKGSRLHGIAEEMAKNWMKTKEWVISQDLDDEEFEYANRICWLLSVLVPRQVEFFYKEINGRWEPGRVDMISETTPYWDEEKEAFRAIGEPCVLDYKFIGRRDRIKSEWEAKHSLQLQMYALKTGIHTAGFAYFLPQGTPVLRIVKFSKEDLDKADRWLTMEGKVIAQRWASMETEEDGWKVFSLAAPDQPLCCKQWCHHWGLCLGKES